MSDPIHESTDEVVCPHCGHTHVDSSEFFEMPGSRQLWCDQCAEPFYATQKITYTTAKQLEAQS